MPKGSESAVHKRLRQLEALLRNNLEAQNAAILSAESNGASASGSGAVYIKAEPGTSQQFAAMPGTPMATGPLPPIIQSPVTTMAPAAISRQSFILPMPPPPVVHHQNYSSPPQMPQQQVPPAYGPDSSYPLVPDLLGTLGDPGPNFNILAEQLSRSMAGAVPLEYLPRQPAGPAAEAAFNGIFSPDSSVSPNMDAISGEDRYDLSPAQTDEPAVSSASSTAGDTPPSFSPPVRVYPGFEVDVIIPLKSNNPALNSYPPDLVSALFQTYFTHLYIQTCFFHFPSFFRTIADNPPVLLYAMMALAAKSCPHPLADPVALFNKAREELDKELEASTGSVEIVQALDIMTLYTSASGGLGSLSFMYSALATRMCIDLGLNQEPYPAGLSFLEQERMRRTFWITYAIDRMQTVAGNRPCAVKDTDCKLRMPLIEFVWEGTDGEEGGVIKLRPEAAKLFWEIGHIPPGLVKGDDGFYLFPEETLQAMAFPVLNWVDSTDLDPEKNPLRKRILDTFSFWLVLTNFHGKVHAFHSECLAAGINPFSPTAPAHIGAKLAAMDFTLGQWFDALPPPFKVIAPNCTFRARAFDVDEYPEKPVEYDWLHSYHTALIHLFYYSIRITLHRPRRLEEMARDSEWLASESFLRCAESADAVARIAELLVRQPDRQLQTLNPASMFLVFQSAVIELLIIRNLRRSGNPGLFGLIETARRKVEVHRMFLAEVAKAWKGEPLLADLVLRLSGDVTLPLATDGPEILQLRGK